MKFLFVALGAVFATSTLAQTTATFYSSDTIVSAYGPRDPAPDVGTIFHPGVDFKHPAGTPIPSLWTGILSSIDLMPNKRSEAGNTVEIVANGHRLRHLHLLLPPARGVAMDKAERFEMRSVRLLMPRPLPGSARPRLFTNRKFTYIFDKTNHLVYLTPDGLTAWLFTLGQDSTRIKEKQHRTAIATSHVAAGVPFAAVGTSGTKGAHLHLELFRGGTRRKSIATLMQHYATPAFKISYDNSPKEKTIYLTDLVDFMQGTPRDERPKGFNVQVEWSKTGANLDGIAVLVGPYSEADIDYDGSWDDPDAIDVISGESSRIKLKSTDCVSHSTDLHTDYICPRPWYRPGEAVTMFGVGMNLMAAASGREEIPVSVLGRGNRGAQTAKAMTLKFPRPTGNFGPITMTIFRGDPQIDAFCGRGTVTFSGTVTAYISYSQEPTLQFVRREFWNWPAPCAFSFGGEDTVNVPLQGPIAQAFYPCVGINCSTDISFSFTNIEKLGMQGTVTYVHWNVDGAHINGTATIAP